MVEPNNEEGRRQAVRDWTQAQEGEPVHNLRLGELFQVASRGSVAEFRLVFGIYLFTLFVMYALLQGTSEPAALVVIFVSIVASTIMICVSVRRLHDFDQSGWFALVNFVPLINFGFLLFLCFVDGTSGPNRFGDVPPQKVKV